METKITFALVLTSWSAVEVSHDLNGLAIFIDFTLFHKQSDLIENLLL